MLTVPPAVQLWYCPDPVDMRLGFDGLFNLVANRLKADPLSGHLFIFRNRTADRLKVLCWGGHGLCLWCQRLEAGRYHFPDCGKPRVCIGEQTAEQLDMEPARFFVLRTVKKSYACPHCDPACVPAEQRIQTAGPGQVGPIAKGLCGPGLLAHVITAKFADHIPLHRQAEQLARSGVDLARSTLGDWLARQQTYSTVIPADASAAVAVAGDPRRRYPGEVACTGRRPHPQGAPVGMHRRCRLPVRGV